MVETCGDGTRLYESRGASPYRRARSRNQALGGPRQMAMAARTSASEDEPPVPVEVIRPDSRT